MLLMDERAKIVHAISRELSIIQFQKQSSAELGLLRMSAFVNSIVFGLQENYEYVTWTTLIFFSP